MSVAVAPEFSARVRRNEPLSRHTSWHVGGPAEEERAARRDHRDAERAGGNRRERVGGRDLGKLRGRDRDG